MRKLIKKYQYGGLNSWGKPQEDPTKLYTDAFSKSLTYGLKDYAADFKKNQAGANTLMNMQSWNAGIVPTSMMSVGKSASNTSTGALFGAKAKAGAASMGSELLGQAPQLLDAGLQGIGVKRAETASGAEEFGMGLMDKGAGMLLKSGNPALMGIGAGLTALTALNKFAGSTAKKQGTTGLDTGGYAFNLNPNAGKKQTLLGTWGGKTRNFNNLTKYDDKQNLQAGSTNYKNQQNLIAANNSFGDTDTKNQQKLFGGITTNILAAKNGAKINPAELRNLSKKAKKPNGKESLKFEDGGKINVIPGGALHARKHNLPEDIASQVTEKGIPVITYDSGGDITQHAEIELNEIIFNKDTTIKLEEYHKKYNETKSEEEKNQIALECGKFLASEILENTDDKTGLLNEVE